MPSKKINLQQFGIIHLPNPDLTYIRNPEIIFVPFHHFETYIRNPSLLFISFFTLPPRGKRRWQPRSAGVYIRVGRWVLPSFYFYQVSLSNWWRSFFLVLPKIRWMTSWFAKQLQFQGKSKSLANDAIGAVHAGWGGSDRRQRRTTMACGAPAGVTRSRALGHRL
jgi:hypothetical protein